MKAAVTERAELGRTGLKVSRLAFGTGYLDGPVGAGARLLVEAYDLGVNFWDTSDDYGTHPHVRRALREIGRDGVVVATKTYAATAVGGQRAVTRALKELGVEAVDVFLLHAVDSLDELQTKQPALEALVQAREAGRVRAVGVSSHSRAVLRRLLALPEVDVALVVVNRTGAWMKDARPPEMRGVIRQLSRSGRGVYGMKALASGEITGARVGPALRWAFRFPWIHSLCVGMTTAEELRANVTLWHASRK
jgi:aryl-alcohol dehydrogenase-like predicted oxidoreductase